MANAITQLATVTGIVAVLMFITSVAIFNFLPNPKLPDVKYVFDDYPKYTCDLNIMHVDVRGMKLSGARWFDMLLHRLIEASCSSSNACKVYREHMGVMVKDQTYNKERKCDWEVLSRDALDEIPTRSAKTRLLLVLRDPRDVLLTQAHRAGITPGSKEWEEWYPNEFPRLLAHFSLRYYRSLEVGTFLVEYGDLIHNLGDVYRDIIKFLGLRPINNDTLNSLVTQGHGDLHAYRSAGHVPAKIAGDVDDKKREGTGGAVQGGADQGHALEKAPNADREVAPITTKVKEGGGAVAAEDKEHTHFDGRWSRTDMLQNLRGRDERYKIELDDDTIEVLTRAMLRELPPRLVQLFRKELSGQHEHLPVHED